MVITPEIMVRKMTTRSAVIALLAVSSLAFGAEDLLGKYKLNAQQLKDSAFDALTNDARPSGYWGAPREFKQIPAGAQVTTVKAIGALLKAWYSTDDFKKRYAEWRAEQLPEKPKPARSVKEQLAEMKANLDKQRATLKDMPPSVQPEMKKMLDEMEKSQTEMFTSQGAAIEKARFDGEMAQYADAQKNNPVDPKEKLKRALSGFLEATKDVEFNAPTVKKDGVTRFKLTEHEEKPDLWKRSFRAGKEVTEAARAFASGWLAELK